MNKIKKYFSITIFSLVIFGLSSINVVTLYSQNKHSEFDVGAMMFLSVSADTIYSNLFKLPVLGGINFAYTFRNSTMAHSITLRGGGGRLYSPYISDPEYPALDDLVLQMNINYASVFKVWDQRKLAFLLGPGLHFYTNVWIPDNIDYDILRYTWNIHTGAGIDLQLIWQLDNKQALLFNMYHPILGVGWRPPYSGYTLKEESILETDGVTTALFTNYSVLAYHNFISTDLRTVYSYQLTQLITFKLEYQLLFEYIFIPRDRMEVQHNVMFGVSFKF